MFLELIKLKKEGMFLQILEVVPSVSQAGLHFMNTSLQIHGFAFCVEMWKWNFNILNVDIKQFVAYRPSHFTLGF